MSETKVNCKNCGTLILEETAHKNSGLCAPCKSKYETSIEYEEKQRKKQVNYDDNANKRKVYAAIFVWLFVFIILCGGIFINYQGYISGREPRWLPLISLGVFIFMFVMQSYNLFLILKNTFDE